MRYKHLYTFIIFSLSFFTANAQEELFRVLVSKGANKVAPANSEAWTNLVIGKKLLKTDKITLVEGGYIGLAHKNGKTIELKKPGVYPVDKLSGEVAAQNSSVSKKYVDFVVGEMTASNEDMAKNRHKYMQVTGSVERGTDENAIRILSPRKAEVLSSPVLLKWQPVKDAKAYVVTISNLYDAPVSVMEAAGNSIIVDLGKLNFKKEKTYLWTVAVKDKPAVKSEQFVLSYVTDEKADKLNKDIALLKAEMPEETALNKIVLASFYEENKLLINAIENYEAAITMEPEVDFFQAAYSQFLERNGLAEVKK